MLYHYYPYFLGLFIGTQIGKNFERTRTNYYDHTEKIMKLESKIKEYEHLFGKIN